MGDRKRRLNDEATSDERSPITHDLDADGMDSESEADELEAGGGDLAGQDDFSESQEDETPVKH